MKPPLWAMMLSAILASFFALFTYMYLGLTASGAGDFNPCSTSNLSGLLGEPPLHIRQRYDDWEITQGDIYGIPPHRDCQLYGTLETGAFDPQPVLVTERSYPGTRWYITGLLLAFSPLLLTYLWRLSLRLYRAPKPRREDSTE
jgi:hypothetical protein